MAGIRDQLGRWRVALAVLAFVSLSISAALTQTFNVIHNFGVMNGDGWQPYSGLALDKNGNLYGTTVWGGYRGSACGPAGCGSFSSCRPLEAATGTKPSFTVLRLRMEPILLPHRFWIAAATSTARRRFTDQGLAALAASFN